MELHLEFSEGRISGDGKDDVGTFLIRGEYDPNSLECRWVKAYLGAHQVFYRGFREGKGIWGTWEINVVAHGGFHIWPRKAGQGKGEATSRSAPARRSRKEATPETVDAPAILIGT